MASTQTPTSNPTITFFGTCPTVWESLPRDQKDLCVSQVQLRCQIQGHYAWAADGELKRQWNETGYREYSAVIEYRKLRFGRPISYRGRIPSHELRLLSNTPSRESASPFIIITSRDKKEAQETISRLQKHPRLCKFGFEYMARQGGLRVAAGEGSPISQNIEAPASGYLTSDAAGLVSHHHPGVQSATVNPEDRDSLAKLFGTTVGGSPHPLCGARIGVYKSLGPVRDKKRNVATIGGVFPIGRKRYALTSAHVFFDNVTSSGSWADSGLYVTSNSSALAVQDTPRPEVSELYEIFVESLWPHATDADGQMHNIGTSIGFFAPQLSYRRKGPNKTTASELIWDFDMDWALIELQDPLMWGHNIVEVTPGMKLELAIPLPVHDPPTGEVFVAAGVSGPVRGVGLGTVGGIMLPWSRHETMAWSIEADIAVGDCGSVVLSQDTGVIYGFIVAHDSEAMISYLIPASAIFESIINHCGVSGLSVEDLFKSRTPKLDEKVTRPRQTHLPETSVRSRNLALESFELPVSEDFSKMLKSCRMINVEGKTYIRTTPLVEWMLGKGKSNASHLEILLDRVYSRDMMVPIEASAISTGAHSSLLVFSILLELGYGHLIHLFHRYDLTDRRLPYQTAELRAVLDRVEVSGESGLAERFTEKQWAYQPLQLQYRVSLDCPPEMVVPIHQRQQINAKGGTATLWEIVVLEDFVNDELREVAANARYNDSSDNLGFRYRFALKSFSSSYRDIFESEMSAFRALRDSNGTIQWLFDYSHATGDTNTAYNILLEYADYDLDEYFFSRDPPLLASDIVNFWSSMFKVADALTNIHQFAKARAGVVREYHGWHADIKPDNILLVHDEFKLTDPSFARFEKSDKRTTSIFGGTRTYGAPEISDQLGSVGPVSRAIDIWSLGCVFSIAATWVVTGASGVKQFSRIRQTGSEKTFRPQPQSMSDTEHRQKFRSHGRFHDGQDVLPEVLEWHAFLRSCMRKNDLITDHILSLLEHQMLVPDASSRVEAKVLCQHLDTIKDIAQSALRRTRSFRNLLPTKVEDENGSTFSKGSSRVLISPAADLSIRESVLPLREHELPEVNPRTSTSRLTSVTPGTQSLLASPSHTPSLKLGSRFAPARLGVTEVLEAMKREKKRNPFLQRRTSKMPRDRILSGYLHSHDIVFIVDNGESMRTHWSQVIDVFTALTAKACSTDEDGVDFTFTTGPVDVRNLHNPSKIPEVMKKPHVFPTRGVYTDMDLSLRNVLSIYLRDETRRHFSRGRADRGLSLIVLTDGVWAGTLKSGAVERAIFEFKEAFNRSRGNSLSKRVVGIQFIYFGNEPGTKDRLFGLDRDLDIVDCEPASGNVYKMLLGAINERWDAADEEPGED